MTTTQTYSGDIYREQGNISVQYPLNWNWAWFQIQITKDGERIDPTWEVLFGKQGRNYQGKQDDYYCFGVDPEDLEWSVEEVVMDILEE